ncbi:MAG TPA: XdhC family protein, partial [Gemmatimonadaceae bacterium]|nr:XdhC family protein [Gemmatimonadaceae bacterium]
MSELLEQFASVESQGRPAALATLVAAAGATPKKAGSTMWVGEDGSILGSVTIGGCVDARVIEHAEGVIASGKPELLRMTLGDEDAWELGLTCGGEVDVLVQRVDPASEGDASVRAYAAARHAYQAGRASMVVSRLDDRRERLVIDENGAVVGTLGDALLDERAIDVARSRLVRAQMSAVERVEHADAEVPLFFERLAPPETLVICGASHVAMSLAVFARELGMRTVIVDGRERMATKARFPAVDEIHVGMPSEITEQLHLTRRSYVALLAHDYKYDLPVLREVLRSDAGYIGMLGSRRRGETIRSMLRDEGFTASEMARLHSPIGLSIGAKSAAEIALAIAAEIVAVREGRSDSTDRATPSDTAASSNVD